MRLQEPKSWPRKHPEEEACLPPWNTEVTTDLSPDASQWK